MLANFKQKRAALLAGLAALSMAPMAHAVIDVSDAVASIGDATTAITTVGIALIGVAAVGLALRWVKGMFF